MYLEIFRGDKTLCSIHDIDYDYQAEAHVQVLANNNSPLDSILLFGEKGLKATWRRVQAGIKLEYRSNDYEGEWQLGDCYAGPQQEENKISKERELAERIVFSILTAIPHRVNLQDISSQEYDKLEESLAIIVEGFLTEPRRT